jgi:hypothetical protein
LHTKIFFWADIELWYADLWKFFPSKQLWYWHTCTKCTVATANIPEKEAIASANFPENEAEQKPESNHFAYEVASQCVIHNNDGNAVQLP